ncbi:MAG TPA: serine hydrolase domain-containing protein [Bryobacteraceae bacterium]|nr:serine hydrolase domain-containing protein [Bryobacteraceae bacterium]
MRFVPVCCLIGAAVAYASDAYPPPRFTDLGRVRKLESALPEIDQIFRDYMTAQKIPGMVWGVVIDGRLAHVGTAGVRDRASNAPVTADTAFRIASMTKSFTVLAILQLRDEGKLSLEDPVSKWLPEFARMELPTRDTAPLKIRQLLSHSAGFPEDNPWGDQQLSATDDEVTQWLRRGIPFSTPPGTRYEYSNYAFGLLGRVVTRVSGVPYEEYVRREILRKLHMDASTFEFAQVPAARRAIGYRIRPDGTYLEEPPLPQGAFSSAGGLLTTAGDLGKYIAFHLSAWPPRDDGEAGPVRRSSVREMSHMWTPSNLTAGISGGKLQAAETGYGYGLRITTDCRFEHMVGHGGGLPGFGSYMTWLPDYGVGLFAMANLTYSGPAAPINQALDVMRKTGGLQKRELPASPILSHMREHIFKLWKSWDDAEAKQIASMNLFLDAPVAQRRAEIEKLKGEVGECTAAGPMEAENWLRGQFNLTCDKGIIGVFFTLSPTQPPAVQHLAFRKIESDSVRLSAPTGAPAGVACRE